MPPWSRLAAVLLLGGLCLLGLALGAESQREVFLEPDLEEATQAVQSADSNLILLTAFPMALGGALVFVLLSRRAWMARAGFGAALWVGLYLLVNLTQGAWPNYNAYLEARSATLANTLLAANLPAAPSVLVPVLAPVAGLLALVLWSVRGLLGGPPPEHWTPERLLRRHLGRLAFAAPFLVVAAAGTLQLLLALPGTARGSGPYFVVLPACILVLLALLGVGLAKAWQLGVWDRNARLAASVAESWQLLGRIEAVLAALLGALAVAASFLAPLDLAELHLGRTLVVSLRAHTQFLVLALLPLVPSLAAQAQVQARLALPVHQTPTMEWGTHAWAKWAIACAVASLGLALAATALGAQALWTWFLALLPWVALAQTCGTAASVRSTWLACFVLWAIGNTVTATYEGNQEGALRFDTAPGLLALWRTLAVLGAGTVAARLLDQPAPEAADGRMVRRLLAVGVATCAGLVAILQMPLWAWLMPRAGTDALAVGSLLASFDEPVRAAIHTMTALLACTGALLLARLQRPEWFKRRGRPLQATVRAKSRAAA